MKRILLSVRCSPGSDLVFISVVHYHEPDVDNVAVVSVFVKFGLDDVFYDFFEYHSFLLVLIGNRAFYFGFSAYWNAGPGLVQGRKVKSSRVVALLEHAGMAFH